MRLHRIVETLFILCQYTKNNWIVHFVCDGDIAKKCFSSQIIIIETMDFTLYFPLDCNIFNFQSFFRFHCKGPIEMLKCSRKSPKSNKIIILRYQLIVAVSMDKNSIGNEILIFNDSLWISKI